MPGLGSSSQTTNSQNQTQQQQQSQSQANSQQQNQSQGQTQSQTSPWAAAMPTVNSLFGALNPLIGNTGLTSSQQTAINQLTQNGLNGNQFAPQIGNVATNLLNGGGATSQNGALSSNLANYNAGMAPYTAANYSTLNSAPVQAALNQIGTDTTDQINSQFAAAGRSGSGENQQTLARGIAAAEAPLILNQANTDTATRQNAINGVYGAGNTTSNAISGNINTGNTNAENGVTAAGNAWNAENQGPQAALTAQTLGQQLPIQNLGLLANIGIPLAGLGSNSSGTTSSNGSATGSNTVNSSASGTSNGTGTSTTNTSASPLSMLTSLGGLFGGGANSGAQGLFNAAGGLLSFLGV